MTDEELRKETHRLMTAAPFHWDRVGWQMDQFTFRRMASNFGIGIDTKTHDRTLFDLPIKIVLEPLPERPMSIAEVEVDMMRRLDDFFVLSLICRGRHLGRTYYIDSEHCNALVKSEAQTT